MSQKQPWEAKAPVYEGDLADVRLQQLSIPDAKFLAGCLLEGAAGARATTEFHPRSYRGLRMWGETVAALRYGLEEHGWESETFHGVDLVVDRRHGTAILVTAGDSATGLPKFLPQVRYERREVIQGLVNGSFDTLWDSEERPEWDVWFLLHRLGQRALSAELSRPTAVAADGLVAGWSERIIIPCEDVGGSPHVVRAPDGVAPPEVDVTVQRRAV